MEGSKHDDLTARAAEPARPGMMLAQLEAVLGRDGAFIRREDALGTRGLLWPPGGDGFTAAEILAEIDLILCDLERLARERPDPDFRLELAANVIASLHDLGRSADRRTVGVGEVAGLISSGWLLVLAGAEDRGEVFLAGVARARAAVGDSERTTPLGRDLYELVEAVAEGEITEHDFLSRLNAARPPPHGAGGADPV